MDLEPTQREINIEKVNGMLEAKTIEQLSQSKPVLVTGDNYLIDGHHRWFALLSDSEENVIKAVKVDVPLEELLSLAKDYPKVSFKSVVDEGDIVDAVYNKIYEASSYANFGGKSDIIKVGKMRLDIEDMDLEPSKHGEERRFRHQKGGKGTQNLERCNRNGS